MAIFSLARAETGARGKPSLIGGGARKNPRILNAQNRVLTSCTWFCYTYWEHQCSPSERRKEDDSIYAPRSGLSPGRWGVNQRTSMRQHSSGQRACAHTPRPVHAEDPGDKLQLLMYEKRTVTILPRAERHTVQAPALPRNPAPAAGQGTLTAHTTQSCCMQLQQTNAPIAALRKRVRRGER